MDKDFYLKAAKLLEGLQFMTLASASREGGPCVTPVFYSYDGDLNFYWLSAPDALHSRNIEENGAIEIVIFDSTRSDWDGFGLYFAGEAKRLDGLEPEGLKRAHETSYKRAGKALRDPMLFTGDFPRHYYVFKPQKAWTNGVEMRANDVPVDVRESVDLNALKSQILRSQP